MDEKNLIDLIKYDLIGKTNKYKGRDLYNYKPSTKPNSIDVADENGEIVTIDLNKGSEIYINHLKLLVNQKIDYLFLKEVTIPNNQYFDSVIITDLLEDLLLNASLDTASWLHFYINDENKIDWIVINDREIIPIYDKYNKYIRYIIRYYPVNKDYYQVEVWDKFNIQKYKISKDKVSTNLVDKVINVKKEDIGEFINEGTYCHYEEIKIYDGEVQDSIKKSFNFIPFIPLFNNKNHESDADTILDLLECYNWISSGIVDNIEKFQEAVAKLKGFSGDSEFLEDTMKNMKKYKAVGIPDPNGDVEFMKIEIPVEARRFIIELLETNIFRIGQGFNNNQLGDGNITNVVIKSRYTYLDHKAGKTIKQLKLFYKEFIKCLSLHYRQVISDDIEFNISQLINESEVIDNCLKSLNIVSRETIIQKHPWVSNIKKELQLIEDEEAKNFEKQQEIFNHPDLSEGGS